MALLSGSPVYTFNLFVLDQAFTYTASVVDANPTATTLALDNRDAGTNATMTFGPWAQITPPPGQDGGLFDAELLFDPATEFLPYNITAGTVLTATSSYYGPWDTYSLHCGIASTSVATLCTGTSNGPDFFSEAPRIFTNDPDVGAASTALWSATPIVVVVTAGADKLASYDSSSASAVIILDSSAPPTPGITDSASATASVSPPKTSARAASQTNSSPSASSTKASSSAPRLRLRGSRSSLSAFVVAVLLVPVYVL